MLCDVGGDASIAYALLLDVFMLKTYHPDSGELTEQEEVALVGYLEGKLMQANY